MTFIHPSIEIIYPVEGIEIEDCWFGSIAICAPTIVPAQSNRSKYNIALTLKLSRQFPSHHDCYRLSGWLLPGGGVEGSPGLAGIVPGAGMVEGLLILGSTVFLAGLAGSFDLLGEVPEGTVG